MFVAWVLFPLLALAVSGGLGLLIERASGDRLTGALVFPIGLAGVVAASQVTTTWSWSAPLTAPIVAILALAGWGLGWRRVTSLRLTPALVAAVAAFLVLGAPVILSGHASFAGYTVLGDTSIHFIGADYILDHGRHIGSLPPSSYEFSLRMYYGGAGYPAGGPTAAGTFAELTGQDIAWVFQPFLALLVAAMALCLYVLAARAVASPWFRAVVAFVAAQPALVFAYAMQGSIKEIGTAFTVTLLAATALRFADTDRTGGVRSVLPFAVSSGAAIGIVGLTAGLWIAPFALYAAVVSYLARPSGGIRRVALEAVAWGVVTAALSVQALRDAGSYTKVVQTVVTSQVELGNLLKPLDPLQMFGVWFNGDYRLDPSDPTATHLIIAVVIAGIALGLVWLVRMRAIAALVFVATSLAVWAYVTHRGSPWADGKALVIVSPAVMFVALIGATSLWSMGRKIPGALMALVIAAGVLGSNALAYHDVSLAPHDRLRELQAVGEQIDGQGPTLYTEFEEFGKHFLRDGAPNGTGEGWQRRLADAYKVNGQLPRQGYSNDVGDFSYRYVSYYRTIVLRRGPEQSRPPSNYSLVSRGRFYDVWRRTKPASSVVVYQPLGDSASDQAAGRVSCDTVDALAQRARRAHAQLAYVARDQAVELNPTTTRFPSAWYRDPTEPNHYLVPVGPGRIRDSVRLPLGGTYDVWLQGSFGRPVTVSIDNHKIGLVRYELNGRGSSVHVARLRLGAGKHLIDVVQGGGSLHPGSGNRTRLFGPVVLTPTGSDNVHTIAPSRAGQLCGRSLDWIEIVR